VHEDVFQAEIGNIKTYHFELGQDLNEFVYIAADRCTHLNAINLHDISVVTGETFCLFLGAKGNLVDFPPLGF
jgi:hypothetical protein